MEILAHIKPEAWIALCALVISVASFVMTISERKRAAEETRIRALQGEKEAVAYEAYLIGIEGPPSAPRLRKALTNSLVLMGVIESSDRARSLVYGALIRVQKEYPEEVRQALDHIEQNFKQYEEVLDLERGNRRLESLRIALGMSRDGSDCT